MPARGKLIFITGAARSGKSLWAETMAGDWEGPVTYIATCVPGDDEMIKRVARHRARRPAQWQTVEEAFDPARIIKELDQPRQIFLLDCMTLLLSNWMLEDDHETDEDEIIEKISELAQVSHDAAAQVIIVSNEVGWGIVPVESLARQYRDILGRANQKMAAAADEAYITVAGIPVELKALARAARVDI